MTDAPDFPCASTSLGGDDELTMSDVYEALADERRRTTLKVLAEESLPLSVGRLAPVVAAEETDDEGDGVSEAELDQIRTALYHVHLPKLDEMGLVDYDHETDTVDDVSDWADSVLR